MLVTSRIDEPTVPETICIKLKLLVQTQRSMKMCKSIVLPHVFCESDLFIIEQITYLITAIGRPYNSSYIVE